VREKLDDLAAVPDVVAAGEDFDPAGEQILGDFGRDAETRGGVLAVGDAEIDLPLREDVRQPLVDDLAAGRTNDIANE